MKTTKKRFLTSEVFLCSQLKFILLAALTGGNPTGHDQLLKLNPAIRKEKPQKLQEISEGWD